MTPGIFRTRSRTARVVASLATVVGIGLVVVLPIAGAGAAQAPVELGTASPFAVLAGSGITNTGPTTITGDVGTHPTPAITGFGTVTMTGTTHAGDAVALQAKNDLTTAYNTAAAATPTTAVPTELGGRTLTPGVYGSPTLGITGTLTLDTLGDPNAVFIFKAGSTLITAPNSSVIVLNGGTACNVFWQVGSSATLGTASNLIGSVLAATSISATTGATVQGRLLAETGAVTMDTNTITRPVCAPPVTTTTTAPPATTTTTTVSGGSTSPGSGPAGTARAGGSPTAPSATPVAIPGTGASAAGARSSGSSSTGAGRGSTPDGATSNTARTGAPGLPVTGTDMDLALGGVGTLALGFILLAGSKLRGRRSTS
jgi:hypothetical protein